MRKVKKSALLLSLAVIMSLLMSMPAFAHGAFITMDSETTVGQEVTATVMFGHFPNADGSILAGDELSWRFYLDSVDKRYMI